MRTLGEWKLQLALAFSLTLILAIGLARPAAAVEFRGGDTITIPADEVIDDDLFIGGNRVVVDGTVNGDLIASGTEVIINGTVNGSVAVGGQSLTINGEVTGSVYGGGASLTLGPNASVGRNLFFGGFSLNAENGSTVGRDLLLGSYQGILGGEVGRDVQAGVGALELNGAVGGDVKADVSAPDESAPPFMPFFFMPGVPQAIAPGLRVGPDAQIGGTLTYQSEVEQSSAIAVQPEGGVVYQTPEPGEDGQAVGRPQAEFRFNPLDWLVARAREFITLLILGGLALWLLPVLLTTVTEKARTQTLQSTGWGLVMLILGYAAALLVAGLILGLGILLWVVTLGGLSGTVFGVGFSGLGLAFTVFLLLVSYGSKLVVAYLVGRLITERLLPQYAQNRVAHLLIGVLVYVIIRGIPLVGWLVGLAATLIGLGAMWLVFRDRRASAITPAPMVAPTG
jgi:hypothetical protein